MGHIGELPFLVTTTLAAQRIVAHVTGTANTVQYPLTIGASQPFAGITSDTVLDTGAAIPVAGPGNIAKLLFNDTVTSGALVTADTNGRGVPYTAATVASFYVGQLIGASVSATGTVAEVLIMPGLGSTG